MILSEATFAFRLSTVGMGVSVGVALGVSVGGMGVTVNVGLAVSVAGMATATVASSVADTGSGAGVEADAQAVNSKARQAKVRVRNILFSSIDLNFFNCTEFFLRCPSYLRRFFSL